MLEKTFGWALWCNKSVFRNVGVKELIDSSQLDIVVTTHTYRCQNCQLSSSICSLLIGSTAGVYGTHTGSNQLAVSSRP